jgi:hypothetical protein
MKAAESTYAGFINLFKFGLAGVLIIVATVVILIA